MSYKNSEKKTATVIFLLSNPVFASPGPETFPNSFGSVLGLRHGGRWSCELRGRLWPMAARRGQKFAEIFASELGIGRCRTPFHFVSARLSDPCRQPSPASANTNQPGQPRSLRSDIIQLIAKAAVAVDEG
jgi:hypothetical protein